MAEPTGQTVLIVDDQADIRLMCRVNLALEGYDVIEAEDGAAGIRAAEEHHPDLVLLDIMMPGVDGWQVLEQLKANPATAAIPVVLLTARVQREDEIRGWSAGASDYLAKPFNPSMLSALVRQTLSGDETADERRRRAITKLSIR